MKPLVIATWVLLMMESSSRAGVVLFDPPSVTITPGTQSVSFETRAVPEQLSNFNTVIFVFGSLEGQGLAFQPDQGLFAGTITPPSAPPSETGIYDFLTGGIGSDIGFGANRFSPPFWTSLTLGVLTVDTSTLVAGDVRQIIVSPELESQVLMDYPPGYASLLGSDATYEPLRGAVTISVIPEPATMVLFLVLSAGFCARGRSVNA